MSNATNQQNDRDWSNAEVCGDARFAFLDAGLVRLEYAPDGRFDDRPTFRAISMPAPQPFESSKIEGDAHVLSANGVEIRYRPTGPFTRDNLTIRWRAAGRRGTWSPGDLDHQNLGGITPLDHVGRTLIPQGVHPAGAPASDRLSEQNLMKVVWEVLEILKEHPKLDPHDQFSPQNLVGAIDLLPAKLRRKFAPWRKFPPGPLSRAGYAVLDETGMAFYDPQTAWIDRGRRPGHQNIFFFYYGRDYAAAMQLFTLLCGRIPIPPRWAFGPWYSSFDRLTAQQNRRIVAQFKRHGVALDVLMIDMDWHKHGWDGWEWNRELYPNPDDFWSWKRKAGIKVALNIHCETIARSDANFRKICRRLRQPRSVPDPPNVRVIKEPTSWIVPYTDPEVWKAVRETCVTPNERLGVDFWWLDNWQGHQDDYNNVLWINHLFCRHMEETHRLRPLILGRYAGIGSHRYPVYFSGDTFSQWEVLQYLLEVNVKAAHVGMAYLSHDLGGFKGPDDGEQIPLIDPELYVRWMQMGALSPIMRVHSHHGTREPWKYGNRVLKCVRDAYRLHTRLVPYFYHLARDAYASGLPLHRPLYFLFPDDDHAYETTDEYMLGERMLAAPVAVPGGRRRIYIPPGRAYWSADGKLLRGPRTFEKVFTLEEIPLYVRAGSIIPQQEPSKRVGATLPKPLILAIYPGGHDYLELYEDDGTTLAYQSGEFTRWPIALRDTGRELSISLEPIRGGFDAAPKRRTVLIEIHFIKRPPRVDISGVTPRTLWAYDENTQRLRLTLRNIQTHRAYRVSVRR